MRLTKSNPSPYAPQTALERELCEKVRACSGETVLHVWTPASYPFTDGEGHPIHLEADYEVRTGRLSRGLFASGSVYRGYVREGRLEVVLHGAWT